MEKQLVQVGSFSTKRRTRSTALALFAFLVSRGRYRRVYTRSLGNPGHSHSDLHILYTYGPTPALGRA